MAEQGGNVILGTVLVKGHHAGQPRGPHMDFHPHMPKAPQGWRHLGNDVVPVFDPQGFKYPFVVRFPESAVSHPRAAEEQTEAMGTDPEEFLGYNPFTASIEIKLHSDYANSDSIAKIEKMIKKNTNIQDVLYRKELIDAVNDNIRNISLVLLALAVVLTFISFALINNTIRLAIYSKRFLIHTMKLVGASWGFIRGPFLRKNVWSGILAAIVADSVLMGTAYWAVTYEQELLQVITPEVMLIVCASVLVFGIVITWLCAYFSMNKYLRMKANSLYYI